MMPVYIRCLFNGSVLELTADGTGVECNPLDNSRSGYQQWYIKYLTGFIGGIFMIISKKNGKALQMDGEEVRAVELNDQDECQQWRRCEKNILPMEQNLADELKMLCVVWDKSIHVLVLENPTTQNACFELQHIAADSYF